MFDFDVVTGPSQSSLPVKGGESAGHDAPGKQPSRSGDSRKPPDGKTRDRAD